VIGARPRQTYRALREGVPSTFNMVKGSMLFYRRSEHNAAGVSALTLKLTCYACQMS
jgi:hypothetical protein